MGSEAAAGPNRRRMSMDSDVQTESLALIGRWVKARQAAENLLKRIEDGHRTYADEKAVPKIVLEVEAAEYALKQFWAIHGPHDSVEK